MTLDLNEWCFTHLNSARNASRNEVKAECPFCNVDQDKFSISISKKVFNCFRARCGAKGRADKLIAHVQDISRAEARSMLGQFEAVKLTPLATMRSAYAKSKAAEKTEIELPPEFIPCFAENRDPQWRVVKYLRERNISQDVLLAYGVGFCVTGKFKNRILVPIKWPSGYAFTGRDATIEFKSNRFRPKYRNPPGSWASEALGGWDFYIQSPGQDLVLVEGPFDMLNLANHGIAAMCLLGKVVSDSQRRLLYKLPSDTNIFLMIDPGEKRREFDRAAAQLVGKFENLYVAKVPEGKDPGDCTEDEAFDAMDEAKKWTGALT